MQHFALYGLEMLKKQVPKWTLPHDRNKRSETLWEKVDLKILEKFHVKRT